MITQLFFLRGVGGGPTSEEVVVLGVFCEQPCHYPHSLRQLSRLLVHAQGFGECHI